jgi:hypothetical protein
MSTTPSPPAERRIQGLPVYELVRHDSSEGPREYSTPEGRFPSVTSILDGTRDKRGLDDWRESIGAKRADQIRNTACARGTALHTAIENFTEHGEPPAFSFLVTPYWKSVAPFLQQLETTLLAEARVWHPEGYAGSIDWLGYFSDSTAQPELADWKTAERPIKPIKLYEYSLQLSAYVAALNHVYKPQGLHITRARLVVAMPCRPAQVEIFDEDALKQLFQHFRARIQRFTYARK